MTILLPFTPSPSDSSRTEYIRWERDHVHHQYADILARIRSGVRVSWKDEQYRVHDETGVVMMLTANPSKAAFVYKARCSIAERQSELAERADCLGLTPAIAKW